MQRLKPSELDVVFLSYDEPEADSFFSKLQIQVEGRAKRVHGVKGFDAAHKAAADQATTPYFVLIDGDAIVYDEFWRINVATNKTQQDIGAFSFCARNMVNDLCYGYGGLKIWSKEFVQGMRTHENSVDPATSMEFCWLDGYRHFASVWNETHINQSPEQAFRAGFREVVKLFSPMCKLTQWDELDYWVQRKIVQWCTIGLDAKNGYATLLGANAAHRWVTQGTDEFEISAVNDYDFLDTCHEVATAYKEKHSFDSELDFLNAYNPAVEVLSPGASLQVKKYTRLSRWRNQPLAALTPCQLNTE